MDSRLSNYITSMVHQNVTDIKCLQKLIKVYVQNRLSVEDGMKHQEFNKRFFPTDQVLRTHVWRALNNAKNPKNDQEHLLQKIEEWEKESPADFFFYRPYTESHTGAQTLIFIHQTAWQKRLLLRYGQDIVFLDASYKRTRYPLPLFFSCCKNKCRLSDCSRVSNFK